MSDIPYDSHAIFLENGPIQPLFIHEAVRTLMRALPLDDPGEPRAWATRRMYCALRALAALNPRDEIEVMLGVQALAAYHAAAACWHIGMNHRRPRGDSTRHLAAGANAARTFDSLLKALERRQAKPLSVPVGRPDCQEWAEIDPSAEMAKIEARCRQGEHDAESQNAPPLVISPEDLAEMKKAIRQLRIEEENDGLDIANTEGILPDGGMIMPANPTPQQEAYLGRRLRLLYDRELAENKRKGINKFPAIRPLREGDYVP